MRILVTGSSGQLGQTVAGLLAARHRIVGLDRVPGRATTHLGSVEDTHLVERAMEGVDAVILTASLHAPDVGKVADAIFIAVNVEATRRLLTVAAAHGVRRVVYTSTTSVYGHALVPTDRAVWVTEAITPQPRDIYDETKLAAEALCQRFAAAPGRSTLCLRIARFFAEPPEVIATHRFSRGVDVRDAAMAHVLAVENTDIRSGVFNISAPAPFVEADMPALLTDAPGVIQGYYRWAERVFARRGWRLPPSIDRVYVVTAAERDLGYHPKYDVASLFPDATIH